MALEDKILYAFVTGEVAQEFWGRPDLTKYDLGVAMAENFYVDFRGGLVSRPGTRYVGPLNKGTSAGKLHRFKGTANDTLLVFGENTIRFVQDGGYVLQTATTITDVTQAEPGVVTSASHGLLDDDLVYISGIEGAEELNGRYFFVTYLTNDTFSLQDAAGNDLDTSGYGAYTSGGEVSKVYTVVSPYAAEDLATLDVYQRYNEVRLTHPDYDRRKLVYNSATNWTMVRIGVGSPIDAPENLTLTASGTGSAGVAFGVTAIDADGKESLLSSYAIQEAIVNYTATSGSVLVTWDPVDDAISYNVYRSLVIPDGTGISLGESLGYIGTSFGAQFTDNNIIADFTKAPPKFYDPFADASITHINITAKGTGYDKSDGLVITDPDGSGFAGYPIINDAGEVIGVSIINGGSDYSSPTVSISTATGSGASLSATVGPASGNNPALFRVFQQRGLYFGTENSPTTLWASKPGLLDNYDYSMPTIASDAYSFTLDSNAVKPIKHAIALRAGLLIFTEDGVQQLRASEGRALTGGNAIAEPQVYSDISDVPPIVVNLDVLFSSEEDNSVQAMIYTEYTESFTLVDLSILASHLLQGHEIYRLEYVPDPYKLIYVPRDDGKLLSLTYLRDQEVSAWTRLSTYGNFKDVCRIVENERSYVYALVERYVGGQWLQFVERFEERRDDLAENYWGVDCGLDLPHIYPAATVYADAATGEGVTLTATAGVFTADMVGDVIYYAGGRAVVTAFVSSTELTISWERDATDFLSQSSTILKRAKEGDWSIVTPTDTLTNLWHLEGETVSVLADGDAFIDKTVSNGQLVLDQEYSKITVGLGYTCRFQTLPVTISGAVTEGRVKKIYSVLPRLLRSRGLSFGASFDDLFEMKDRTNEDWGEALGLRSDVAPVLIADQYDFSGQICGEQTWPLPASILGLVLEVDFGE